MNCQHFNIVKNVESGKMVTVTAVKVGVLREKLNEGGMDERIANFENWVR